MQEKNVSGDIRQPSASQTPIVPQSTPPNSLQNAFQAPQEPKDSGSFFKDNKWAIYLIVLSLLAIAGFLFYLLKRPAANPTQPKVSLTIEAPSDTSSGNEVVYKIHFANQDSSAMQNVGLDLTYPSGFSFEDSTPKATRTDGTHFDLPNVDPSEEATIMIRGTLVGDSNEVKSISGRMRYRFANFSSDFISQAQSQTTISQSSIALQFAGKNKISNNNSTTYDIAWSNTAQQDFSGLKLHVDLPGSFKVEKYSTDPDIGTDWNLGTLKAGANGKLSITGHFENANVGDSPTFTATIQGPDQNGQVYTISSSQYFISIATVPITAEISLQSQGNGQPQGVANPGDALSYTVHYQNNDATAVTGVILTVTLSGDPVHLSSIQAPNASINGNVITWDGSGVSQFSSLNPNSGGDLSFRVNVKNPATQSTNKNLTINAQANIKSVEYPNGFNGSPVAVKIATVVNVDSTVAFNTGANPPQVGQSSTYMVVIFLRNSTNDVNNGVLTLNLPRVINFDLNSINSSERGNVTYDTNTKKITWSVGKLGAHLGDFNPPRKLQFNVTITPNYTDNNQPMPLANNIRFSGTDSFINQAISIGKDDISTANDPSGNGIVGQ